MLRVGIVGCGTIGTQLSLALQRRYARVSRITALHDRDLSHAQALQRRLRHRPPIVPLPQLIRRADVVLEAASPSCVPSLVRRALRSGRSVMVMSVGGLLGLGDLRRLTARSRARLYVPSGALAGLDGIKALAIGRIRRASLTTSKPPRALAGAPYVTRRRLNLAKLTRPTVIFSGSPRDIVKQFPQNTNVAAALALATGAPASRIRIRLVADPSLKTNRHEVEVIGDCGRVRCTVESRPSRNPKTSEIAARSAVATLERLFGGAQVGT